MADKYIFFDESLNLSTKVFILTLIEYLDFIRIQNEKNKFYKSISVHVYHHNINENEYLFPTLVDFSTQNFIIIMWIETLIETI